MQHGVLSSIHRGLFQGLVIQGIITGPARTFKSATAFRIRGRDLPRVKIKPPRRNPARRSKHSQRLA